MIIIENPERVCRPPNPFRVSSLFEINPRVVAALQPWAQISERLRRNESRQSLFIRRVSISLSREMMRFRLRIRWDATTKTYNADQDLVLGGTGMYTSKYPAELALRFRRKRLPDLNVKPPATHNARLHTCLRFNFFNVDTERIELGIRPTK